MPPCSVMVTDLFLSRLLITPTECISVLTHNAPSTHQPSPLCGLHWAIEGRSYVWITPLAGRKTWMHNICASMFFWLVHAHTHARARDAMFETKIGFMCKSHSRIPLKNAMYHKRITHVMNCEAPINGQTYVNTRSCVSFSIMTVAYNERWFVFTSLVSLPQWPGNLSTPADLFAKRRQRLWRTVSLLINTTNAGS